MSAPLVAVTVGKEATTATTFSGTWTPSSVVGMTEPMLTLLVLMNDFVAMAGIAGTEAAGGSITSCAGTGSGVVLGGPVVVYPFPVSNVKIADCALVWEEMELGWEGSPSAGSSDGNPWPRMLARSGELASPLHPSSETPVMVRAAGRAAEYGSV